MPPIVPGVLGLGNAYRALDAAVVMLVHDAGGVWRPAATPSEIDGLIVHATDPRDEADIATAVTSDAEVNDGFIAYGDLDVGQVNARLSQLNIIVRASLVPPGSAAGLAPI